MIYLFGIVAIRSCFQLIVVLQTVGVKLVHVIVHSHPFAVIFILKFHRLSKSFALTPVGDIGSFTNSISIVFPAKKLAPPGNSESG